MNDMIRMYVHYKIIDHNKDIDLIIDNNNNNNNVNNHMNDNHKHNHQNIV